MKEAIDMVIRLRKCQRSLGDTMVRVKYCDSEKQGASQRQDRTREVE